MGFKIAVCPSCNATITVPRLTELEAENARLREALSEIREIYTGSEGIPNPETAAEAYVLVARRADEETTTGGRR